VAGARARLPFDLPEVDYEQYSNRQLVAVPLVVLALALAVIAIYYVLNGVPVGLGIAFTGGTEVSVAATDSQAEVRAAFDPAPASVRPVLGENIYILTFPPAEGVGDPSGADLDRIRSQSEDAGYRIVSSSDVSASFGGTAQIQALAGVAVAFLGMSALVFVLFRTFVPSIAVVASAFSDIVIPVALMNLFGIELSLGTVAALLMLIGYSVDSDLLLNNHVLRRRGGFYESTYRAMRTGVTMTLTSISAMTVMTIVSFLLGIPLLPEVGIVLVFGLVADLMNTYMLNVTLLRYYKYEAIGR
jgi:preprotein translocase subunit SecF